VQEMGQMTDRERKHSPAQDPVEMILFALLFILVTGIWACLWVPPLALF